MQRKNIPTIVLGGSGYVASELVGLLMGHPSFRVEHVVSTSHAGERISDHFPHLAGPIEDRVFSSKEEIQERLSDKRQLALFSALPHGETASLLAGIMDQSPSAKIVDVSADFRLRTADEYQRIYGHTHPSPEKINQFYFGLPDLSPAVDTNYISHPGCFSTGVSLALAPLTAYGLIHPRVSVSSVTGSTGAGKNPGAGTHHPHRQSSMWAYQPLVHRHLPEIELLTARGGESLNISFVPHSGPFSRGIHSTVFAQLQDVTSIETLISLYQRQYERSSFVKVGPEMPRLKDVVGTNRCHIGIAVQGDQVIVTSVIDNLVKGAAGGAIQWMNRLFGIAEEEGLHYAVPGWI
mgnify:CR=1 FL=1